MAQPLWKTVWRFLKKLKTELSHDLAIPLLGIYQTKLIQKDTCSPMFTAALVTGTKMQKQPSADGCVDKEDAVHIHNGILLSHKKE